MIKKVTLLAIVAVLFTARPSFAQTTATATQTVNIQVAPAIEILTNTLIQILTQWKKNQGIGGNGNGWWMTTGGNDGNGLVPDQQITVRSNKGFIVSVKSMEGTTNGDVLLALVDNRTGGKASGAFEGGYAPVGATSQDLLSDCAFGNERSFAVNYKTKAAKAKQQLPTKADIIYTATLP